MSSWVEEVAVVRWWAERGAGWMTPACQNKAEMVNFYQKLSKGLTVPWIWLSVLEWQLMSAAIAVHWAGLLGQDLISITAFPNRNSQLEYKGQGENVLVWVKNQKHVKYNLFPTCHHLHDALDIPVWRNVPPFTTCMAFQQVGLFQKHRE